MLFETILYETSTLSSILDGMPNKKAFINAIHSNPYNKTKKNAPYDQQFVKYKSANKDDIERILENRRVHLIIIIGSNGACALYANNELPKSIYVSYADGVIHNDLFHLKSNHIFRTIGKIISIYITNVVHNEKAITRFPRNMVKDTNFSIRYFFNRFQPILIKYIKQAIQEMEEIHKRTNSDRYKSTISVLTNLVKKSDDKRYLYASLDRAIARALMDSISYLDSKNDITNDQFISTNQQFMNLMNDVVNGDMYKLGVILGYFKQELLKLNRSEYYK